MRSVLPSLFGHRKRDLPIAPTLHNEIDRVFDEFCGAITNFDEIFETKPTAQLKPKIDTSEAEKLIQIVVEIPGLKEYDLDVSSTNNVLVIKGEKPEEREEMVKDYRLVERPKGSYLHSILLGFDVKTVDIKAEFQDDILKK